ncbi:hypothetical protein TCE0_060f18794 [Talaromyces pinophilus]|uniref:Uncharacterized protein n=1 Tax=Talaromyces pinophilus TaxID=128442 RepID=A0A6V8HP75_TALPI|nr:hypothetical protein TCE0_060f18794 [Talaromyces pinophilus]
MKDRSTSASLNKNYSAELTQTPVSASLNLVSFKSDICTAFLLENFVWRSFGCKWLHLAASGKISPLALQASSALSQSNFGSFHRQQDMKINGSILYGKAVRSLIPELSNPMKTAAAALIVPIMILLIHESLLADSTGSASHVRGLIQLMMVCGPAMFQKEPLRSAFESCRAMLITIDIISKKRCFLDEENWQSVPWVIEPNSKSPQNYLADILGTVPGMLEDDAALSLQDDSMARATLLDRVEHQLVKLFQWRWKWEKLNRFSAWEELVSSNPSAVPGQDRIFNSILCFSAFEQATEIVLYNAVQMWLVGLLWRLAQSESPAIISSAARIAATQAGTFEETNVTPLLLPGMSFSLREPAIEICRVFEYQCLNAQHNRGSALFCLLPIGLAYGVLERESRYQYWIRSMLDLLPVMKGYVLGQNVMGVGFHYRSWRLPEITP